MKRGRKRGLSPVIASVLMIMLVLVLAAMIFLWARGFISEQIEKFGKPVENLCSEVQFKVSQFGNNRLEVFNYGNVDIRHLDIKMFDTNGNSEIKRFPFSVDAGKAVTQDVQLEMDDLRPVDKIIIYPALLGNIKGKDTNQVFTCMGYGVPL